MATYEQIREWVKSNHQCYVKGCWIAHAKEIYGIPVRKSPNRYNENERAVPCPDDKLVYIKEAFEHFGMIKD